MHVSTIEARLVKEDMEYNGQTIKNLYIGIFIDGRQVRLPFDYLDIAMPPKARIYRAYPFTCSCGESGCAGWHEGYKVKHRKNTVEWKAIDPRELRDGTRRFYSFERGQYEAMQCRIIELGSEIVQYRIENPEPETDDPYSSLYDYDLFRPTTHEKWDAVIQWRNRWRDELEKDSYWTHLTIEGRCV